MKINLYGFLLLLGLLFIGLKLGNAIAWSWLLVLLPIWGPIALALALAAVAGLLSAIATALDSRADFPARRR